MARIRTVKPDFFRHEGLQDLENLHPKLKPMLTFQGLWVVSDRNGVFEWKPRTLKLDILPFLDFEISETLQVLEDGKFVERFASGGKDYGFIPSWDEHQRITGKEATTKSKYPEPPRETTGKQLGNNGETTETTGKGKERKGDIPADVSAGYIPENWIPNETSQEMIADFGVTLEQAQPAIRGFIRWARESKSKRKNWDLTFQKNPVVKSDLAKASRKPKAEVTDIMKGVK